MDIDPSEQNIEKLLQLDQQGQTQRMANLERSMKALEYAKAEFGYFGEKHLKGKYTNLFI